MWLMGKQDKVSWENSATGCRRPGSHVNISQTHGLGTSPQASCLAFIWRCVHSQINYSVFLAWIVFLTCLKIKSNRNIQLCLLSWWGFPRMCFVLLLASSPCLLTVTKWEGPCWLLLLKSDFIVISESFNYKILYSKVFPFFDTCIQIVIIHLNSEGNLKYTEYIISFICQILSNVKCWILAVWYKSI